jgi:hypothetical protein
MSDHDIERLCIGYRQAVQDPPYDAADAALLRAAARRARRFPMRHLAYGIAATLLAALGLAAGVRSLALRHRPSSRETLTAATPKARATRASGGQPHSNEYLSAALLSSSAGPHVRFQAFVAQLPRHAVLQPRDTGFLQETSALSSMQADPTCGTAAAVDLNAPGALDGIRLGNPGDYGKITRIIAGVTRHPEPDVARWIGATFHAGSVSYLPLWMTSLPPKRRLSFCLDSTPYTVVLTITPNGARVSPVDYSGNARSRGGSAPRGTPGNPPP